MKNQSATESLIDVTSPPCGGEEQEDDLPAWAGLKRGL